jgi:hypothetical protein
LIVVASRTVRTDGLLLNGDHLRSPYHPNELLLLYPFRLRHLVGVLGVARLRLECFRGGFGHHLSDLRRCFVDVVP